MAKVTLEEVKKGAEELKAKAAPVVEEAKKEATKAATSAKKEATKAATSAKKTATKAAARQRRKLQSHTRFSIRIFHSQ